MDKKLKFVTRLVLFFVGMSIIQLGVAMYLKANIGSDPFTVFTQGLSFLVGSTPGRANMIISVVLFCAILLIKRSYIKIGTLICVIGVGPIIDLGVKAVSYFPIESYNTFAKALVVVLGCVLIGIGFSILSASNIGMSPNDIVPFIIKDTTKFQYRWIRMGLDVTFFVIGLALGGVVGIGTILSVLITGPIIQFCLPYGEKFVRMIVGNNATDKDEKKAEASKLAS